MGPRTVRRAVLRALGGIGLGTALSGVGTAANGGSTGESVGDSPAAKLRRRVAAELRTRIGYSRAHLDGGVAPHESNDRISEEAVVSKFGKGLAHDDRTGCPTAAAYDSLVAACERGEGYDRIETGSAELNEDDGILEEIDTSQLVDRDGAPGAKPLVQPETAWTAMTEGKSTAQLRIAVPPAFDSAETGAEMVELYWRALTRDVPFTDYDIDGNDLIEEAVDELADIEGYRGPGSEADPTSDALDGGNVFRGITPGAQTGPYVSQFLWKDRVLGGGVVDQKIEPPVAKTTPTEYMTDVDHWLKVQKGVVPPVDENLPGNEYADDRRYIITGRDMCERVHDDPPFRQVQKAAQVLLFTMDAPLDEGIPYTLKPFDKQEFFSSAFLDANEHRNGRDSPSRRDVDRFLAQPTLPFNDFGPLYVEKKVIEATEHGQKAAWHKKWNVHRRLRPEEYGGRVEAAKQSGDLDAPAEVPVPENLLTSDALAESERRFGSFLLPQAYAEGSPTHPSYPAGHSVVAGAGVTVLKAFFDGDYVFPTDQKVVPTADGSDLLTAEEVPDTSTLARDHDIFDELTVRGELNKLASNMALGRNRAGIHYRSDGIEGLRLGESAAIHFLEDQLSLPRAIGDVRLHLETFDGEERTVEPTV